MQKKSKHKENRLLIVNNPNAPRLSPELANEIGLNESILFLQLEFWIATNNNERDGRKWVYKSVRDLQQDFPFWSPMTINRALKSLEDKKLITVANYNAARYDKTRWFAINLIEASKLKSVSVESVETIDLDLYQNDTPLYQNDTRSNQNDTRSNHFDTTIPDTTTDTTTDIKQPRTAKAVERKEIEKFLSDDTNVQRTEEIYQAYPLKEAKGEAFKAIAAAALSLRAERIKPDGYSGAWPTLDPLGFLLDRVKSFAPTMAGKEKRFIPHPATWFNQKRYLSAAQSTPRITPVDPKAIAAKYANRSNSI